MQEFPPSSVLEPDIDAYGSFARVSAVADFLELSALREQRVKRADVADYISDMRWGSIPEEAYATPETVVDEDEDPGEELGLDAEDVTGRIFSILGRRSAYLGARYPFKVGPEEQSIEVLNDQPSPYLALLGITIGHAFDVNISVTVTDVFEDTVARAFENAGHQSLNFARIRKDHRNFRSALIAAGKDIDLCPTPDNAMTSSHAQDAGCDVLAHIASGFAPGHSYGAWALVGQVTCGHSNSWKKKLHEVEVPAWKNRLGLLIEPQAFLAIPHDPGSSHLHALVRNNELMIFDRMRLTRMLDAVSDDEDLVLSAVRETPVASLVAT